LGDGTSQMDSVCHNIWPSALTAFCRDRDDAASPGSGPPQVGDGAVGLVPVLGGAEEGGVSWFDASGVTPGAAQGSISASCDRRA
jgi:hypothetical protein